MTYLTEEQVKLLLRPIHPRRVLQRDGMSYVEGYDIRAELNRVFGFGRWSATILDQSCIREVEVKTRAGKDAWYVVYRTRLRLTIEAPDGSPLATYDGSHVGESTHPVFGEAHGNALTNSETYALRRAAINLGDQFGLSLYNKGSLDALVRWTLVRPEVPEEKADTDDVPQVAAEETSQPAEDESDTETFPAPRDVNEPEMADEARMAHAADPPCSADPEASWLDRAVETARTFTTEKAGGTLWREASARAHKREITGSEAKQVQDLITIRIEELRKAESNKLLLLLSENDEWRLKVEELADAESARNALDELGKAVTAKQVDMTRANRISRAIVTRFPKAAQETERAA